MVKNMLFRSFLPPLVLLAMPAVGMAQASHHQTPKTEGPPSLNTASVPTPYFDHKGRLWLAWAHGEHVYVNYSDDLANTFSAPVKLNQEPQQIHTNGETRPKISVDTRGNVFVAYTQKLPTRFTGNIRFSRSSDGGKNFNEPYIVNDDTQEISHRFVSMLLDDEQHIHLSWLDARDFAAAKRTQQPYQGSAVYYARSADHGISFERNQKLADNSCQCCRIAADLDGNTPVYMWRHIFENKDNSSNRDHALLRLGDNSSMQRVSYENWQVNGCPHHGPSLSINDEKQRYHMTWFNHAADIPGIYYGYSDDAGQTQHQVMRIDDQGKQASHPYVLHHQKTVWLVWKAFDGERTQLMLQTSNDDGDTWQPARAVADTLGDADHPLLLQHQDQVYASWQRRIEGYRLIPLTP